MTPPFERARLRGRALRLRCPLCGNGPLFAGLVRVHERCSSCGFRFEREPGYFLGSIYINYGASIALAFGLHLLLSSGLGLAVGAELAILLPIVAAAGLVFFRWSRALWMAFDLSLSPPDEREFGGR